MEVGEDKFEAARSRKVAGDETIRDYRLMIKCKDNEILWLKSQLKGRQCDDYVVNSPEQQVPKKNGYTEEDLMLRILELKHQNQLLNCQLETLEGNLHEAYREKDDASKLLREIKQQLQGSFFSEQPDDYANKNDKAYNDNEFNNNTYNDNEFNNNTYNDNATGNGTSMKLASVIEKMAELKRKGEEERKKWQEERQMVIAYQRKLQEKLLECSEEKWRLEKKVTSLKVELDQMQGAGKKRPLGAESYC